MAEESDSYLEKASVELARAANSDLERRVVEVIESGESPLPLLGSIEGGTRSVIERADELRREALTEKSDGHFIFKVEEENDAG